MENDKEFLAADFGLRKKPAEDKGGTKDKENGAPKKSFVR